MDLPIVGKRFYKLFLNKEGSYKTTKTIRIYVKNKYNVDIGMYTYGSCFASDFNIGGQVTIGRYCSFAQNIHYFGGNHPMNYASMSPYFYNKEWGGYAVKDISREHLKVGHDVWCGYGVIITNKCRNIGNGAVIAAGSVVTKDVPAYAVVAGSPAKIIRYRFDEQIIKQLEDSHWYDLEPDELMEYYYCIDSPKEFSEAIIREKNQYV